MTFGPAAESGEESDESEGEAKRQDEEDLINFGEIADKLNEFGEAAKQKFKIFADKISNLFEGDHPPQPPAPTGYDFRAQIKFSNLILLEII